MMRWDCNRRCSLLDYPEWFIHLLLSSISRRQEGRCSGSSPAKRCEHAKEGIPYADALSCTKPGKRLRRLYRRSTTRRGLCARSRWGLIGEIAFLRGTLENIIGRV